MVAESSTLDIEIGPERVGLRFGDLVTFEDRPDLGADALDRLDGLRTGDSARPYGCGLMDSIVFGEVEKGYVRARDLVKGSKVLRIRLRIDEHDDRLRGHWWEGMVDERSDLKWPSTYNGTPFSRYLGEERRREPSSTHEIKVLAAVSNPTQLGQPGEWSQIPPLVQEQEDATIKAAFASLDRRQYEVLTSPASGEEIDRVLNVGRLEDGLKDFHVLHIVAPAFIEPSDGLAYLLLEDETERVLPYSEDQLVQLVMNNRDLQLVILAGAHSVAAADGKALVRLATRLVEVGLPAAIAMQSRLPSDTAARFLGRLYQYLSMSVRDGEPVDKAVNQARYALQNAVTPKSWGWLFPVLFMRGDGRLFDPLPDLGSPSAPSPFGASSAPPAVGAPAPQPTAAPEPKGGGRLEGGIALIASALASSTGNTFNLAPVTVNKGVLDMSKQEINAINSQVNAPTDQATVSNPTMTVNTVPFDRTEMGELLEQLIEKLRAGAAQDPRLDEAADQLEVAKSRNKVGDPPEKFKDSIENAGRIIESADDAVKKGLQLGETLAKVAAMARVALPWIAALLV